jgi:hypothetical protein
MMTASKDFIREVRRCNLGEEPSLVDEYAHLTMNERIVLFLDLRRRVIEDRYETEPRLERVVRVTRIE